MPSIQVKPSPEGVPGALTDPSRIRAEELTYPGAEGTATFEERTTELRPRPPLEMVDQLRCPLLAAVGAEDHNPSAQLGERLREALAKTPRETRVDIYEGAGHAFFADYRPTYRPAPAALLWERVVPFLARHLKDGE